MSAPMRTLLALAWRESRTARRRLALYMSSIALGVAALVAIDSFAANVGTSARAQSKALLGGDVALSRNGPFSKGAAAWLDSLASHGTRVARVTSFASMALAPRSGGTRLVQVRAVSEAYPIYGEVTTQPAGRWNALGTGAHALVDRSLLVALDASIGDTLVLGYGRFTIAAALDNVPGDPGIAAVLGPRVYIPARYLAETHLLGFGARAQYEALIEAPAAARVRTLVRDVRRRFGNDGVRARTVADTERGLTRAIDRLTDFLSIVGLIALLLGGVGVASGVSAFVSRKIDTVAVLRCLGATSRQILAIYVTQVAAMGLLGAACGAAIGIGLQILLPHAIGEFLPVDVEIRPDAMSIATGMLVGLWVSLVFALRPLLALRRVSPLQAIRREVDRAALRRPGIDWPRRLVELAIVASVVGLTISRTGRLREGLWLSAGIGGALLVLGASAVAVTWTARRLLRAGWPYVVRQGIANLYRPGNQTRAVTLALGFGAFLVTTVYLVQTNLLRQFDTNGAASRANVVMFDIQEDQIASVDSMVRAAGTLLQTTPIVTMRIAEMNGTPVAKLVSDTVRRGGAWALRREFRSTYRDTLTETEKIVAGAWKPKPTRAADGTMVYDVSLDRGLANDIHAAIGTRLVWDVQGARVATRVTSLREIQWERFDLNFFALFPSAAIERAPKQFAVLANVSDPTRVARLQRDIVTRHPNVSSVDLSLVQSTVGRIVERVSMAVRFLALFSLASGLPVLFSAVAATRRDRLREGVLLKTLGATRAQILRVLVSEYAVLGALGALAGMLLAFGGAWALVHYVFEGAFAPDLLAAAGIAALLMLITVTIGLLTAREVFRETPMAALRES